MDFKHYIRGIPDFPKPGILFYDISPLLGNATAWHTIVDHCAEIIAPYQPDQLVGLESRGFLVASAIAYVLDCGVVMIRKQGKLPGKTIKYHYALEYGSDVIEIQEDAIKPGQRAILVDDLIATGGTAKAAISLLSRIGALVPLAFFIVELTFLKGM